MNEELKKTISGSLRRSLGVSWTILTIMIPVSLAVTILQYTGLLERIAWLLSPVMGILSLPSEASFALMAGALINIYAGIAVMGTLGLSAWDINIMAVMMLICHNLVVESAVQSKTGVSGLKMTLFRVAAAVGMGICLSFILPESYKQVSPALGGGVFSSSHGFTEALVLWVKQTSVLTLKVISIIAAINLTIDIMRYLKAFDPVMTFLRPFSFLHGLPKKASFMWMAGILFGLAYGSGVLIAEARTGRVDKDSLVRLNLSLGISHSLIEDTLLFVAIGASLFWVLIPRMAAAAVMVWVYVLFTRFFPPSGKTLA